MVACLFFCGWVAWNLFESTRWPVYVPERPIPDRDIVFVQEPGGDTLGFINADGSGLEYVRFRCEDGESVRFQEVTWSSDGQAFFWVLGHWPYYPFMYRLEEGRLKPYLLGGQRVRGANFPPVPVSEHQVVAEGIGEIFLIDLWEIDKPPTTLVSTRIEKELFNIGFHPLCGDLLVFRAYEYYNGSDVRNKRMVFYNLANGSQITIAEWATPSCSPDGRWIGYSTEEGLYLIRPDGSGKRKMETLPTSLISWSPDGKWMVYSMYPSYGNFKSYGIFKMNVDTGERVKLVDGGYYPYWRQGIRAGDEAR